MAIAHTQSRRLDFANKITSSRYSSAWGHENATERFSRQPELAILDARSFPQWTPRGRSSTAFHRGLQLDVTSLAGRRAVSFRRYPLSAPKMPASGLPIPLLADDGPQSYQRSVARLFASRRLRDGVGAGDAATARYRPLVATSRR